MRDKPSIRREIEGLDLPHIVLQIFDGNAFTDDTTSHVVLSYRCADPYNSLVDESGLPDSLLPLWECSTKVTAYDKSDGSYCQIDLEAPDEVNFRVNDFDGVAADTLIDLWEAEIPDDVLVDLASQFGFRRLPQLVSALEGGAVGDYNAWRSALRTNKSEQVGDGDAEEAV